MPAPGRGEVRGLGRRFLDQSRYERLHFATPSIRRVIPSADGSEHESHRLHPRKARRSVRSPNRSSRPVGCPDRKGGPTKTAPVSPPAYALERLLPHGPHIPNADRGKTPEIRMTT